MNLKRRVSVLSALFLVIGVVAAAPASAHDTETVETFTDIFTSVNPCTGLEHEITINVVATISEDDDGLEIEEERTGTTDDGFVLEDGEQELEIDTNGNVVEAKLKDEWQHPDGREFTARGRFKIDEDTGEVLRDEFSLTCDD